MTRPGVGHSGTLRGRRGKENKLCIIVLSVQQFPTVYDIMLSIWSRRCATNPMVETIYGRPCKILSIHWNFLTVTSDFWPVKVIIVMRFVRFTYWLCLKFLWLPVSYSRCIRTSRPWPLTFDLLVVQVPSTTLSPSLKGDAFIISL